MNFLFFGVYCTGSYQFTKSGCFSLRYDTKLCAISKLTGLPFPDAPVSLDCHFTMNEDEDI